MAALKMARNIRREHSTMRLDQLLPDLHLPPARSKAWGLQGLSAMDQQPNDIRRKSRETILSLSLLAILGGAILFFLNFVSLGIFFYVFAAIVGIAAVGFLHYMLWGYALSQQVAGEREEERIKAEMEEANQFVDDRIERD